MNTTHQKGAFSHRDFLQYQSFKQQHKKQLQSFMDSLFKVHRDFRVNPEMIMDGTYDPISYPVQVTLSGTRDQWRTIIHAAEHYYFHDENANMVAMDRLREETLGAFRLLKNEIHNGRMDTLRMDTLFQR